MANSLLELACLLLEHFWTRIHNWHNILKTAYSCYKTQHVTWWNTNASNSRKSRTGCHEILKSWINVTWFAKIQHNGAYWNFQYKASIKLCVKTDFIKNLWGNNFVAVTPIYKKLGTIGLLITSGVQILCHHLCTLLFLYAMSVCLPNIKITFI